MFFPLRVLAGWVRTLNEKIPLIFLFETVPMGEFQNKEFSNLKGWAVSIRKTKQKRHSLKTLFFLKCISLQTFPPHYDNPHPPFGLL